MMEFRITAVSTEAPVTRGYAVELLAERLKEARSLAIVCNREDIARMLDAPYSLAVLLRDKEAE